MIVRTSTIVVDSTEHLTPGDWLTIGTEFMKIVEIVQVNTIDRNEDGTELLVPGRVLVERKAIPHHD